MCKCVSACTLEHVQATGDAAPQRSPARFLRQLLVGLESTSRAKLTAQQARELACLCLATAVLRPDVLLGPWELNPGLCAPKTSIYWLSHLHSTKWLRGWDCVVQFVQCFPSSAQSLGSIASSRCSAKPSILALWRCGQVILSSVGSSRPACAT